MGKEATNEKGQEINNNIFNDFFNPSCIFGRDDGRSKGRKIKGAAFKNKHS